LLFQAEKGGIGGEVEVAGAAGRKALGGTATIVCHESGAQDREGQSARSGHAKRHREVRPAAVRVARRPATD
jgi:hypothetical protein